MKVVRLSISNFRGVKSAEIHFDGHTLMVGPNNVGKSTVFEALDLVLGPDRLGRFPPVEEFDFHNAAYLAAPEDESGEPRTIPIRIEVVLTELTEEVENRCGGHIEFWKPTESRLLEQGEAAEANPPETMSCLRLETVALYSADEDEFEAQTWFSHSPDAHPGELAPVRKDVKRLFGFLYLRTLRTGSRALSLERGSLLDLILRLKGVRTGLWEKAISRLKVMDIGADAADLDPILADIEMRLSRYIPSNAQGRATKLHVSQLTREHLRKTMSFFLAMSADQDPVPFQQAGTGTLNTLVLALLSFIADLKPETVIFAMEEPEIAVPPHTQRRIADYLLQKTTQAFVTSHSPFVIERFEPAQTLLLSRSDEGAVGAMRVSDATGLKDNDYKRYARRGLTECMLGRGAVVGEGVTEFHALPVAARRLEEANPDLLPLDIAGVAFFDADSDGSIPKFGAFFKALGLKTFSFYDHKTRKPEEKQKFASAFDVDCEHQYAGFEELVAAEMPSDRLWTFLSALRDSGENGQVGIPAAKPTDDEVRNVARKALASGKGAGWAARLFEECELAELPGAVTGFLMAVHAHFPKLVDPAPPPTTGEDEAQAVPAADTPT
ncbi:MAG: AAA family ATPase [Vicinamibacteria bacterium]|nr:AAA family ATPase [Vicinamibacteria bacterium]